MKTTKPENNVKIVVTQVGEFIKEKLPEGIDGSVRAYTDDVEAMESAIDVLDGYDDFDSLKIAGSAYRKTDVTHEYGIPFSPKMHTNSVILKHQEAAAAMFLKNLRGFGLLADVVGSGKTFEAGVVLSELVYRGRVGSLLIIVPSEVIDSWQDVLIRKFGLGFIDNDRNESALITISRHDSNKDFLERIPCKDKQPQRPVLVDLEIFKDWAMSFKWHKFSNEYLFDMIIVDEAHELCKGENLAAMSLLSHMIHEKKMQKGDDCYCLLLSATPHDGDLKSMFNLWYFIRRKGGCPKEFLIPEDRRSEHGFDYNKEHDFYTKTVCYGADNVSDFIRKKKIRDFSKTDSGIDSEMRKRLAAYLETVERNIAEFDAAGEANDEWVQYRIIEEYLENNPDDKERERQAVANAYRELLGLIMIRQSRKNVVNVSAEKKSVNVYFYPIKAGSFTNRKLEGISLRQTTFSIDYSEMIDNFPNRYYPDVIMEDKRVIAMNQFLDARDYKEHYADIINGMFIKLKENEYALSDSDCKMFKFKYEDFYTHMLRNFDDSLSNIDTYRNAEKSPTGQFNLFVPYEFATAEDSFTNKLNYTIKILNKHADERVIIFFDYELDANKERNYVDRQCERSIYDKLESELRCVYPKRSIISIDGSQGISTQVKQDFDDDKNSKCILIVKGGYTHGANLQKAAVIINFQVSCDPVDMEQKMGRIFRLGQDKDVIIYSLVDMNELEGYSLAYFTRIGLFATDSGDATILSGCNNSEMVTIRCREGDSIEVMTQEEYNENLKKLHFDGIVNGASVKGYVVKVNENAGKAWVKPSQSPNGLVEVPYDSKYAPNNIIFCGHEHQGTFVAMEQINNNKFECSSNRAHILTRHKTKSCYTCMDPNASQEMVSVGGKNNRTLFCNKLCALAHCSWHKKNFPDCKAVAAFNAKESYLACIYHCQKCKKYDDCKKGVSGCSCLPSNVDANMEKSIEACTKCREIRNVECRPKPHILRFNDEWNEADCPICRAEGKTGKLRIVPLVTFSDHVRYLWDIDTESESSFCRILEKEAENVGELEELLRRSGNGNN